MANRSGMFLTPEDRESLLRKVAKYERRRTSRVVSDQGSAGGVDDGCRICGMDNDHGKMLLCERCSAEYHYYCVGLQSVPNGDWYCDKCRDGCIVEQSDGLDLMVAALPPQYTSRFGEVVWAQGGPGFGWWPSYIYDPSMTVKKNVRSLAQKNLGKRHLVYFFQCIEAPFDVLLDVKITEWYDGLAENYHLGKAARSAGKNRTLQFEEALKIAVLEMGKPLDQRMDWNHPDPPLSPQQKKKKIPNRKKRRASKPLIEGAEIPQEPKIKLPRVGSVRTNLLATLEQHHLTCALEVDDYLYVRVLRDRGKDKEADNVGFVQLQSQTNSTFAHARQAILNDLEPSCLPKGEWKFYIPSLGPMSTKQETSLGPMLKFLQDSSTDPTLGNGSCRTPVKALICEI